MRSRQLVVVVVGAALAVAVAAPTVLAAVGDDNHSLLSTRCGAVELVAHRGMVSASSLHGPDEDTALAMVDALRHGATTSESDSRHDRSGTFWEIHDASLDHASVQTGLVADRSTAQMQAPTMTATDGWQHLSSYATYLYTFMTADHGRFARSGRTLENEIKRQSFTPTDARVLLRVAAAYGALPFVHWSSLDVGELGTLHDQALALVRSGRLPRAALHLEYQLLLHHGQQPRLATLPRWVTKVGVTQSAALAPYGRQATFIAAAHARGIEVNVWNAQKPATWATLLLHGVDAISTDHVDGFRDWCARQ